MLGYFILFYFMFIGVLPAWMFLCVCVGVSEALELELQTIVSHHVGAENQTQVLSKSSKCLNY